MAKQGEQGEQDTAYRALSTVAAIGAGILVRNLVSRVWTHTTGEEPPANPADPSVAWRQALGWAVATGAAVGVARVLGRRLAAGAWTKASGKSAPVGG